MAIRSLTFALAAAALTVGASAQAAAPVAPRASSPIAGSEQLGGTSDFLPFAIFIAAILAIVVIAGDEDEDFPTSP